MSAPASPSASPSSKHPSPAPEKTPSDPEQGEQHTESSASTSDAKADEKERSTESPDPQSSTSAASHSSTPGPASAGVWQAVWSPAHNAYYFYNAVTQETTWTNPLEQSSTTSQHSGSAEPEESGPVASTSTPASTASPGPSAATAQLYALQAAAAAQGIDPSLAFLDPSLAAGTSGPTNPAAYSYTAKFNARTGTFARPDARDPGHLSEYERMKRMNEVFFDQAQWEQQLAQQKEEEEVGKKRKKPTKKDLVSVIVLDEEIGV